jgi:YYY domain-containing protein
MLTAIEAVIQQAGGTWASLFDWEAIQNKYPAVGVILWYLAVALLGWVVYPLVRIAFPSLKDRGYPLARLTGLLLLAFIVWLAGSAGMAFSRLTISLVFVFLMVVSGILVYRQRQELLEEWREKSRYFWMIEILALAFFSLDLLIRLGNPDLWHPYLGGEKPMDFSYLQAVIKSSTFPPYDPWFGGGTLNYYYFGFLMVGTLAKWLGIVPSVAYNLILPTLFSGVALGAFSFGWNILHRERKPALAEPDLEVVGPQVLAESSGPSESLPETAVTQEPEREPVSSTGKFQVICPAFWGGLASTAAVLLLGNLGTVRMIWQGFEKMAAPNGDISQGSVFVRIFWIVQGVAKFISGSSLPYGQGSWYWLPSRAIQTSGGFEITEFPFFTFLYADLHAHLMALGLTLLVLTWALSILLGKNHWSDRKGRGSILAMGLSYFIGALAIGALRVTNTWDYPTYLAIGGVSVVYTLIRYFNPRPGRWFGLSPLWQRILTGVAGAGVLAVLSYLLFYPFNQSYGQGYDSFDLWTGQRTPFGDYLIHWGVFFFIIVGWMVWETLDWMRATPMKSLVKLRPYLWLIEAGGIIFVALAAYLTLVLKVEIAWLGMGLGVWAVLLIFRPGQSDLKRGVLFMVGTGLVLTLFVEFFVLVGDIGRMNTVFKYYFQAWTLFALSAAAALGWLLQSLSKWRPAWRTIWQVGLVILVASASLYPLTASIDKIRDRMAKGVPLTLDGMAYMQYSFYTDPGLEGVVYDLSQDYAAIRWMQENVEGSPIIVEGNTPEYRWGSRFTIYTGLPGVVGWNWHQRQQRAILSSTVVTDRIAEIETFYDTTDRQTALDFLQKYNVQYIIVGQLEEGYYDPSGLVKFAEWNGDLWQVVYQSGSTAIYKVNP